GNNTWAGNIALDSNASLGAASGTSLNITGQISDLGAGHDLAKVGAGKIIFSHVGGNTYRGLTTVANGTLTIRDPFALGFGNGTAASGPLVKSTTDGTATLQLEAPSGVGFLVPDELLTLNGGGFGGIGALNNLNGNNNWSSGVILGSPNPDGANVSIGVAANTNLTIDGVVSD